MSQLEFDEDAAKRLEAMYRIGDAVRRRAIVREALGAPRGERVLDVGCGPGFYCAELLEDVGPSGSVLGLDGSAAMLALAAGRCAGHDNVEFLEADATSLPVEDASFDVAFAICVVHHVPPDDWDRFATEMRRAVRPGGIVAVFEHNPYNPLTRKAVSGCEFDADAVLLSRRRASSLLAGAGLQPVESRYILFFPREGDRLRATERRLGWLPLGAQYYVASRRG